MTAKPLEARLHEAEAELSRLREENAHLADQAETCRVEARLLAAEVKWRRAENETLEIALVYQARLRANLQAQFYASEDIQPLDTE